MRGLPRAFRIHRLALLSVVLLLAVGCSVPQSSSSSTAAPPTLGAPTTTNPPPTTLPPTSMPTTTAPATEASATDAPATDAPATDAPATAAATTTDPLQTTAPQITAGSETATPAVTGTTAPTSTTTASVDGRPKFGVVAHLYYTDRERVTQLAANAGFEWIRQQVAWKDTEKADRSFGFDELDQVVNSVNAKGQKLLLSVVKSPDFLTGRKDDNGLPKDPKDFGRFVEELATRYKGKVQAIEVWNEQNLAVENGGHVTAEDAGHYVEILKEAYTRIKAVDPSIIVVAGALSSTGVTQPDIAVDDVTYLKAMYAYNGGEIKNYFDVQGFHPASAANPPDTKYPEDPGNAPGWNNHPTHYFRHIEDVHQVMVDSGLSNHKIWITEMGWATKNNTPGYEYGNLISVDQQAQYLEGALFRTVFQYGDWVDAVFIWNLNFAVLWNEQGNPLEEQASFGLLNPDWSPRPAFTVVQGFINAVKSGEAQR